MHANQGRRVNQTGQMIPLGRGVQDRPGRVGFMRSVAAGAGAFGLPERGVFGENLDRIRLMSEALQINVQSRPRAAMPPS